MLDAKADPVARCLSEVTLTQVTCKWRNRGPTTLPPRKGTGEGEACRETCEDARLDIGSLLWLATRSVIREVPQGGLI